MNETSDAQLLRDYATAGNEAAFRELVTRHTDFVYSAAARQVDSPDLACDIAQSVFTDLARKARPLAEKIPATSSLAGWLHRSTRYAALNYLRDTHRRLANERQAMEQLLTDTDTPVNWEQIRPALDEGLETLDKEDREALLLRYFKNQDFRTVGHALGVSDDTAQKRVSRAVDRLREFFNKRGVTVGASGLVVIISANAVQAAPVGLTTTISTAVATVAATTLASTATVTATKAIAMTTLQKTIIAAAFSAAIGVTIYQAHQASNLRSQIQGLQKTLGNQAESLANGQTESSNRLAALAEENSRLNRNAAELLKLRAEVTRLHKEISTASAKMPEKSASESGTNTPPFQTYSATNHVELNWGQTLVAGGWKIPSGDRALMFATLTPIADGSQMAVHLKIAEVTDESLKTLWPDGLAADDHESKAGLLERDQYDSFIEALMKSGSSRMRDLEMSTLINRQCQLALGEKEEDTGLIGITPQVSADGKKVNLEITSSLNFPTSGAPK